MTSLNKEYWRWLLDPDGKECKNCEGVLVYNGDHPYCETCGSHTSHACLNCGYWYDDVWEDKREEMDEYMRRAILGDLNLERGEDS